MDGKRAEKKIPRPLTPPTPFSSSPNRTCTKTMHDLTALPSAACWVLLPTLIVGPLLAAEDLATKDPGDADSARDPVRA